MRCGYTNITLQDYMPVLHSQGDMLGLNIPRVTCWGSTFPGQQAGIKQSQSTCWNWNTHMLGLNTPMPGLNTHVLGLKTHTCWD